MIFEAKSMPNNFLMCPSATPIRLPGALPPDLRGGGGLFLHLFGHNSSYFRPSGMLPIDPARRELQNPIGEIEIGDSFDF